MGRSSAIAQESDDNKTPSTRDLLAKIKLSDGQRKKSKILSTPSQVPASYSSARFHELKSEVRKPDAVVHAIKDGNGKLLTYALRWTCPTNVLNDLQVDGIPLNAQTFSFSVENISWQAGDGWPVYHVYCPRDDYGDMYYPNAKIHQIVPSIVGVNYFVGCSDSATCTGDQSGQVRFAVNDGSGDYGDNRGTFDVFIYSYS
jgi:hypothetical protein